VTGGSLSATEVMHRGIQERDEQSDGERTVRSKNWSVHPGWKSMQTRQRKTRGSHTTLKDKPSLSCHSPAEWVGTVSSEEKSLRSLTASV